MHTPSSQFRDRTDAVRERQRLRRMAARRYTRRLVAISRPRCVILHGSVARDQDTFNSDVDLIVVSEALPNDFPSRLDVLSAFNHSHVPIESLGYTPREFEQMLTQRHVTALDAMEFGVPLYGKRYFNRLRKEFETMKAHGLRRTDCTWTLRGTP